MNIYQKINEIMRRIEYLTKDDNIKYGNTQYKAITEEKVTTTVRKELVDLGVVILPVSQTKTITELARTDKGVVNQRADVDTRYRIINIDDPEDFVEVVSSGSGVDTQDKAIGKAMTYAYKYMLLRSLSIPTGEDPDKVSSEEIDDKMKKIEKAEPKKVKKTDKIDTNKAAGLRQSIQNNNLDAKDVLQKYGYEEIEEITYEHYSEIVSELKAMAESNQIENKEIKYEEKEINE